MLACQICNRKILFNELVMFGRPDGGVEPKDVPFVLATQAYLMYVVRVAHECFRAEAFVAACLEA